VQPWLYKWERNTFRKEKINNYLRPTVVCSCVQPPCLELQMSYYLLRKTLLLNWVFFLSKNDICVENLEARKHLSLLVLARWVVDAFLLDLPLVYLIHPGDCDCWVALGLNTFTMDFSDTSCRFTSFSHHCRLWTNGANFRNASMMVYGPVRSRDALPLRFHTFKKHTTAQFSAKAIISKCGSEVDRKLSLWTIFEKSLRFTRMILYNINSQKRWERNYSTRNLILH